MTDNKTPIAWALIVDKTGFRRTLSWHAPSHETSQIAEIEGETWYPLYLPRQQAFAMSRSGDTIKYHIDGELVWQTVGEPTP